MQATMFQPVGGGRKTDSQPRIRKEALRCISFFNSTVAQIRYNIQGCAYRTIGTEKTAADGPVDAGQVSRQMPLRFKHSDADFSLDFHAKPSTPRPYDSAVKIAWESRRFWAQDLQDYGGSCFHRKNRWWRGCGIRAQTCCRTQESVAGYSI